MYYIYNESGQDHGPFSLEQLQEDCQNQKISRGTLVRSENSEEWLLLATLMPQAIMPGEASVQNPECLVPTAGTLLFVTTGNERKGPFILEQVRRMYHQGILTAETTVEWEGCTSPVQIHKLLNAEQKFKNTSPENVAAVGDGLQRTDIFAVVCFATGMMGLVYAPEITIPIAYVTGIISYFRLKENPQLLGKGIRLTGAIAAVITLLGILYSQSGPPSSAVRKALNQYNETNVPYRVVNKYTRQMDDETIHRLEIETYTSGKYRSAGTYNFVKRGKFWYKVKM